MLMALKRNQKGLTLIELLAVLVIVGIIAAIAIPAIGGTISKSKTKADTASEKMIQEAALRYVIEQSPEPADGTVITESTLVSGGYLNAAPTFNDGLARTFTAKKTASGWSIVVTTAGAPSPSPTTT
ncbi:prepilin-type N-terminal cleavage/methylation domain-containing protein [Paenibacillus sp. FJAT-27812]|uniref:prepilin-type N-terminal cleavage/methylation domain-containing protein n=1 Tax=Paenibacillus sp. FJAT-27812 TaxID=1684143 RepID=UPI0006A76C42|nr:prepilin-type N-terminal cleavage/methylation domain-containing protein [Paenibacillus sp. FJAT-27812]